MNTPDSFGNALAWIVSIMLGDAATAVAVIAVAGVGFAMLQGRQSARDGIRVFLGCVILFNAPTIAKAFSDRTDETIAPSDLPPPVPHPPIALRHYAPAPYDPYAGASVPQ
jgi:hypothetical protein